MIFTYCQNCGGRFEGGICPKCRWSPSSPLKWHDDQPSGWTPERAKACYEYCEGVGTALLTAGGLARLRDAHADLQLKYDVLVKRIRTD